MGWADLFQRPEVDVLNLPPDGPWTWLLGRTGWWVDHVLRVALFLGALFQVFVVLSVALPLRESGRATSAAAADSKKAD